MIKRCDQIIERVQKIPVWCWLTGILLLGFLLKLLCWHWDPVISRDGCLYIQLAQIWYNTNDFQRLLSEGTFLWLPPPLPLFLMKSLMHAGVPAEITGVWMNLIAGTFLPLLGYGIAWEVTKKENIAVCSALLLAVNPSINELSIEIQRDVLYLGLIGVGLWLLVSGIRRQKFGYWIGAGAICACAMLTRFETLEFVAIVPMVLFLLWIGKFCSWKKAFCYAGLFFLTLFGTVCALSFLMQNHKTLLSHYETYYQVKLNRMQQEPMETEDAKK